MYHLADFQTSTKLFSIIQHLTKNIFTARADYSALFCILAFGKRRKTRKVETVVYHLADFYCNHQKYKYL